MFMKDEINELRYVDKTNYPELNGYSDSQIYDYFIGCGGLYLAVEMVRKMNLKPGDIVLDLGCGFGSSSIYLSKTFDVTVIGVDFWFPPAKMNERIAIEGLSGKVIPLNLDITQIIPFSDNYFDAIFCMNSLFLYGDNPDFIGRLLRTLKPGGSFCIGSECFNLEPGFIGKDEVPFEYNFEWHWDVWDSCFSKYHSPQWWRSILSETGLLDIKYCEEVEDGIVFWEDMVKNYNTYFNERIVSIGAMLPQDKLADMIMPGRNNFHPSLYVLSAIKK